MGISDFSHFRMWICVYNQKPASETRYFSDSLALLIEFMVIGMATDTSNFVLHAPYLFENLTCKVPSGQIPKSIISVFFTLLLFLFEVKSEVLVPEKLEKAKLLE